MEFTLSLALLDFLPVLFTGMGLLHLGRFASWVPPVQGTIAFAGGILVLAGGFFSAVWKYDGDGHICQEGYSFLLPFKSINAA
jgi:hypothetical protein